MSKKNFLLSLILVVLAFTLSACTLPWQKKADTANKPVATDPAVTTITNDSSSTGSGKLKKFSNYDELTAFLAANNNPTSVSTRGSAGILTTESIGKSMPAMSESASAPVASDSSQPNNSLNYSTTNNQVAGVDEADIIKTDGRYIYALVRNELSIISASPAADAKVVAKITFKSRPQDIFINGNYLAVFGSDNQIYTQEIYRSFLRQNSYSFFKVFDITDPANPKQVRDLDFEGSYRDARLVGDYVYFITDTYNNYIAGEPIVPRVLDNGSVLPLKCEASAKCFAPDVYYFDIDYDSYNFTNITAINIKNSAEAISGQSYLLNSGQNIYVSKDNIYITYTQYLNEYDLEQAVRRELIYPKLSSGDQDKITKIEATPNYILNNREKLVKASQYIDRYLNSLSSVDREALSVMIDTALAAKISEKAKDMEKTIIHKIGISGNQISYKAMGEVSGQVLNQFSMDENGNYFRIATTRSQYSSRLSESSSDSYSSIYVLDSNLQVVGRLENLATTEKIYAARFMGNRVYLVTFKQTDPLFVISLSDPAAPKVLGAIKIPGFSNYLHPVDKDGTKLIGLGREADVSADGSVTVKGLKLSLFDFSDLAKPKELDSYILGGVGSDSIALTDHKAFLYSADKNLLVIPAALRDANYRLDFAGSLVFNLVNDAFVLKGKIDHSSGGHYSTADYWDGYGYYDNTAKRSLYINDALFTFSNKFLKINSLVDMTEVKSLELTAGGDDYIITPMPSIDSPSGSNPSEPDYSGTSSSSGGASASEPIPAEHTSAGASVTDSNTSTSPESLPKQ